MMDCDWCAFGVGQALAMGFGALAEWFSPAVFGTRWCKAQKRKIDKNVDITIPMAVTFAMIAVMNGLLSMQNLASFASGAQAGLMMFLPVFATHCIGAAWSEKPVAQMLIELGHEAAVLVILGGSHGYFGAK
eukprot:534785_1